MSVNYDPKEREMETADKRMKLVEMVKERMEVLVLIRRRWVDGCWDEVGRYLSASPMAIFNFNDVYAFIHCKSAILTLPPIIFS